MSVMTQWLAETWWKAIENGIGLPKGYGGTIWSRVNRIREFFNTNEGFLLIIDEADKEALERQRELYQEKNEHLERFLEPVAPYEFYRESSSTNTHKRRWRYSVASLTSLM